ncbi:hypothetical protein BCV70DRAFT_113074 [Testicularia cyperi]|uniref:Uncharacterized protein n=1 Tax=Testicularia cyperi TaxID=1882483 RepID=A0A317XNX8_9BASI|nr:hypothetical protein BCV70DRAFT_113074 [Testicularia cyperi]
MPASKTRFKIPDSRFTLLSSRHALSLPYCVGRRAILSCLSLSLSLVCAVVLASQPWLSTVIAIAIAKSPTSHIPRRCHCYCRLSLSHICSRATLSCVATRVQDVGLTPNADRTPHTWH